MNDTIATRLQVLLSKLAGNNIDLSGFVPDVASSPEEKLMLDIANRLDGFAKSSDAPSNATTAKAGLVKQAENVVPVGSEPTAGDVATVLNSVIAALIAAGVMDDGTPE